MTAAIDKAAGSGPRVLVAPEAFTATVIALYDEGLSREKVRGVVLMNPRVDQISLPKVSTGASALLVLIEETQKDKEILGASLLTSGFAAQGVFARLRFVDQDTLKPEAIRTGAVLSVKHFMGGQLSPADPKIEILKLLYDGEFTWPALPLDNRKLREMPELLSKRPMHDGVKFELKHFFRYKRHMIHQWPLATYDSFDLLAYRDRTAPGARYVVLRNRIGMIFVLDLDVYGAYEPEIVAGIDDEPNMYRIYWFFRTNLEYSWLDKKPNLSARPLGPFLSFRKPLPRDLMIPVSPGLMLSRDGIEFSNEDPLAAISAYPDAVRKVITKDNQCIYCHQIEGRGGRAHHLDAMTAQPQGGYALPLSAYSEEVMRQFMFDQKTAAAKIGVTPNPVDEAAADAFFAWTRALTPSGARSGTSPH